jgi:hypothetical protein
MSEYIDVQYLYYKINKDVKIFSKNITTKCCLLEVKILTSLVEKNKGGFTYAIKRENINYFIDELQEYVMNSSLGDEEKDNICYALQKYKIN